MKWTEIAGGPLNRTYITLMTAFGERADEVVCKINNDPRIADRVVSLVLNNGYELSVSQAKAREIMGKNFFGLEDAQKHFGVNFLKRHLTYMTEVPVPEDVLTMQTYTRPCCLP